MSFLTAARSFTNVFPSRRFSVSAVRGVLLAVSVAAIASICSAQGDVPTDLPTEQANQLQQILAIDEPTTFAVQASAFWKLRKNWSPDQTNAVRATIGDRAKQLVSGVDLANIESGTLQVLLGLATPSMSSADRVQLLQRIEADFPMNSATTFGSLLSRISLSDGLIANSSDRRENSTKLTAGWLSSHELSALTKSELNACFRLLCPVVEDEGGFEVVWTGFITPPRSGEYTFSISPWNSSMEKIEDGKNTLNEQSMSVTLGGEVVIDARPKTWLEVGKPINLSAGETIPMRVKFMYSRNDDRRLCPAILYWQGPGIEKSVVPNNVLSCQQEGVAGLAADYVWTARSLNGEGQQIVEKTIDANIDFVWLNGLTLGTKQAPAQSLAAELVTRWTRVDGDFVGDLARQPRIMAILTSRQLGDCLQALLEHPDQLNDVSPSRMERFYYATRCGADSDAIDVLGTWMSLHDYVPTEMASDTDQYFRLNRLFYYRLAGQLAFENSEMMELLETRYLATEDGECRLSVAMTLSACHLMLGTVSDWIEQLDSRLADESLTGDKQVDWLIARSQAEEIRYSSANRYYRGREQLLAGSSWLDEAALVAESSSNQLTVARERIARIAALGHWEAIDQELASAALKAGDMQQVVNSWRTQLSQLRDDAADRAQTNKQALRQAYLDELQRRRIKASNAGDQQLLRAYDRRLSEIQTAAQ